MISSTVRRALLSLVVVFMLFQLSRTNADTKKASKIINRNRRFLRVQQQVQRHGLQGRHQVPFVRKMKIYRARHPSTTPSRSRVVQFRSDSGRNRLRVLPLNRSVLKRKQITLHRRQHNDLRQNHIGTNTLQVGRDDLTRATLNQRTAKPSELLLKQRVNSVTAFNHRRFRSHPSAQPRKLRTRLRAPVTGPIANSVSTSVHDNSTARLFQRRQNTRKNIKYNKNQTLYFLSRIHKKTPRIFTLNQENNLPFFTVHRVLPLPSNIPRFHEFSAEDLDIIDKPEKSTNLENLIEINTKDDHDRDINMENTNAKKFQFFNSSKEFFNKTFLSSTPPLQTNFSRWWQRNNVCVDEEGMRNSSNEIFELIYARNQCKEVLNTYTCTRNINIGGHHILLKVSVHRCCPGYALSADRQSCQARAGFSAHNRRSFRGSTLINRRLAYSDSPIPRSAPEEEVFTIFMPNNDVVEAAFSAEENTISGDEHARSFFENHVILNQKILSTQMRNNQILTAFSGNPIRVNFFNNDLSEILTANCRRVSVVDMINGNSILHFIDDIIEEVRDSIFDYLIARKTSFSSLIKVLRASGLLEKLRSDNGTFTLFAPTDEAFASFPISDKPGVCLEALARNHIVRNVVCSAGVEEMKRKFTTMQNMNLTLHELDGEKYVGTARLTEHDVMATNGVVHVIDQVLKPPSVSSILDILSSNKHFSMMLKMFDIAGIKSALATGTNFTLIVPSNKAFKDISKAEVQRLTTYVEDLRSVLMHHLIPSTVNMDHLRQSEVLETLNPPHDLHIRQYPMKVATVRPKGSKRYTRQIATTFQCARIIGTPKTMPCNGALYFVDKVILPPSGTLFSAMMYSKRSNFSQFLRAIRLTRLQHIFEGTQMLTLFAPSDVAFSRFPEVVKTRLFRSKLLLARVIKFHLVPGYRCKHELLQRPIRHVTALRSKLTSCPKRGKVYLGRVRKRLRAKMVEGDIEATNGVIHAIDNLLLPKKFKLF